MLFVAGHLCLRVCDVSRRCQQGCCSGMGSREHPQLPAATFSLCDRPVGSRARSPGHPTSIPRPYGVCGLCKVSPYGVRNKAAGSRLQDWRLTSGFGAAARGRAAMLKVLFFSKAVAKIPLGGPGGWPPSAPGSPGPAQPRAAELRLREGFSFLGWVSLLAALFTGE